MKAYLCRRFGGPEVVELAEVPTPQPKAGEILIRIHATTVTAGDWRVRSLSMPKGIGPIARLALGFRGPRQPILGTELAGVVEAVGAAVTRYRPGDAVIAFPGSRMRCHAEYRVLPEDGPIAPKPERLSFAEGASLCFGASTALHFLQKAGAKRGDTVLVIGASGAVGTALVQVAHHRGCTVTGVTSSANVALVAELGASQVIDYTRDDPFSGSRRFDIIADTVGVTDFIRCRTALNEGGRFLAIAGGVPDLLATAWAPLAGSRRVIAGPAAETPAMVREIAALAESGVLRPVIGHRFDFAQMAEAHALVESRHKRGSAVVQVRPEATPA